MNYATLEGDGWRIARSRYAKGKWAIHCVSDGSGMKTRPMRIASTLSRAKAYSGREKAYIVSLAQAARFVREVRANLDACVMTGERY